VPLSDNSLTCADERISSLVEADELRSRGLLDYREAARMLGVSPASIRRWSRMGRLRCVKLGKSARYERRDLEALIARGSLDPGPRGKRP